MCKIQCMSQHAFCLFVIYMYVCTIMWMPIIASGSEPPSLLNFPKFLLYSVFIFFQAVCCAVNVFMF